MTLRIRAPWLRTFADRLTRRESAHPLRDAWERMQALQCGLDFHVDHCAPTHSEIADISNVVPFRREP